VLTVGSNLDEFGGEVKFSRDILAEIAEDVAKERAGLSVFRDGSLLNLVIGTSGWADALKRALELGEGSAFSEAYPEAWELLRMLPQSPPAPPVAAGFARVEGGVLEEASGRLKLNLSGVTQALGSLNVSQVTFVAYAEEDLSIKESIGPDFFREHGASVAVAMRSGYPGYLLGFFLDSFASQAGLEKGNTVAGVEVLTRDLGDAYLVAEPIGSVLFLSVAPDRARAEALMGAILGQQGK
ncbi:MAG: hypothetical protein HY533_01220, partial [Chloroflexi bacterium]|nr:hypothetical protein [Chloroflexota bacterium]